MENQEVVRQYGNATVHINSYHKARYTKEQNILLLLNYLGYGIVDLTEGPDGALDFGEGIKWDKVQERIKEFPRSRGGYTLQCRVFYGYEGTSAGHAGLVIINPNTKTVTTLAAHNELINAQGVEEAQQHLLKYNTPNGEGAREDLEPALQHLYDVIPVTWVNDAMSHRRMVIMFSLGVNNVMLSVDEWEGIMDIEKLREQFPGATPRILEKYLDSPRVRTMYLVDTLYNVRHLKGRPRSVSMIQGFMQSYGDSETVSLHSRGSEVLRNPQVTAVDFKTGEFTIGLKSVGGGSRARDLTVQGALDAGFIGNTGELPATDTEVITINISGVLPLPNVPKDVPTVNYNMLYCAAMSVGDPVLASKIQGESIHEERRVRKLVDELIRDLIKGSYSEGRSDTRIQHAIVNEYATLAHKAYRPVYNGLEVSGVFGRIPLGSLGQANTHYNHLLNITREDGHEPYEGLVGEYARYLGDLLRENHDKVWDNTKRGEPREVMGFGTMSYEHRRRLNYHASDLIQIVATDLLKEAYRTGDYDITVKQYYDEIVRNTIAEYGDTDDTRQYIDLMLQGKWVNECITLDDGLCESWGSLGVKVKKVTKGLFNGNKEAYNLYMASLSTVRGSHDIHYASFVCSLMGKWLRPFPGEEGVDELISRLVSLVNYLNETDAPIIIHTALENYRAVSGNSIRRDKLSQVVLGTLKYGLTNGQVLKVIEYILEDCDQRQRISVYNSLDLYYDYLSSVQTLVDVNIRVRDNFDINPQSLKLAHDVAAFEVALVKEELDQAKWDKNYSMISDMPLFKKPLTYRGKNYELVIPKGKDDLVHEGKGLSHCVGSYLTRIIEDHCIILMLRNKDDIDTPFITVEFNKRGAEDRGFTYTLGQVRGLRNKDYKQNDTIVKYLQDRVDMVNDYDGYVAKVEKEKERKKKEAEKKKREAEAKAKDKVMGEVM